MPKQKTEEEKIEEQLSSVANKGLIRTYRVGNNFIKKSEINAKFHHGLTEISSAIPHYIVHFVFLFDPFQYMDIDRGYYECDWGHNHSKIIFSIHDPVWSIKEDKPLHSLELNVRYNKIVGLRGEDKIKESELVKAIESEVSRQGFSVETSGTTGIIKTDIHIEGRYGLTQSKKNGRFANLIGWTDRLISMHRYEVSYSESRGELEQLKSKIRQLGVYLRTT